MQLNPVVRTLNRSTVHYHTTWRGTLVALTDEVREWLERSGFPLEMQSAAAFRQAGFEVRQSSHYIDPENGKDRELDVLATDPDYIGVVQIHFVIECKSGKKP